MCSIATIEHTDSGGGILSGGIISSNSLGHNSWLKQCSSSFHKIDTNQRNQAHESGRPEQDSKQQEDGDQSVRVSEEGGLDDENSAQHVLHLCVEA